MTSIDIAGKVGVNGLKGTGLSKSVPIPGKNISTNSSIIDLIAGAYPNLKSLFASLYWYCVLVT